MANENALKVPGPAMRDSKSFEVVRAWIAESSLQVSLRTGVWDNPADYGVLLFDIMQQVAIAYEENEGFNQWEILEKVKAGLDEEFAAAFKKRKSA